MKVFRKMEDNIRGFTEQFFRKLGCLLREQGEFLRVENVPEKFENFVGKKGPFVFSFDGKGGEGIEVLRKGGYFLNAMANFLQTASKITLIKLDVPLEAEREILSRFTFPNSRLVGVRSSHVYQSVTRFLFTSKFQFLNEREHETISVFVKDGKIFDVDPLALYSSVEGNKKDVEIPDFSKEYDMAREVVKKKVAGKVERISLNLHERLQKEIQRIEGHHDAQVKEIESSYNGLLDQIARLKQTLEKKNGSEKEKIAKKMEKISEEIKVFDLEGRKASLAQERELLLKEEKNKHKLAVGHQLINTSVIYYPIFSLNAALESERARGSVIIEYDPVQKFMAPVICPATNKPLYKVYLDDAGLACSGESLMECFESGKHYCASTMTVTCAHSGRIIHPSNAGRCSATGKQFGKSYLKIDSLSGATVYQNLLKFCSSCGKYALEKRFVSCPSCGARVCPNCLKKVFVEGSVKTKCGVCKK